MHRRHGERVEDRASTSAADLAGMGGSQVLAGTLDVSRIRETTRRGRLWRMLFLLVPVTGYLYYRILNGQFIHPGLPSLSPMTLQILPVDAQTERLFDCVGIGAARLAVQE